MPDCPLCYHINPIHPGETPTQAATRLEADIYNLTGVLEGQHSGSDAAAQAAAAAAAAAAETIIRDRAEIEAERRRTEAERARVMEKQVALDKAAVAAVADKARITKLSDEIVKLGGVVPPPKPTIPSSVEEVTA